MLGLAGIAGALGAPIIGRISDRRGPRLADLIALTLGLIAFALLLVAGRHLAGLIGGILPLDLATQANLVSNQTRIYSLLPDAANRLNLSQPRISDLIRGKISRFSLDALVNMLSDAGLEVDFRIKPASKRVA